MSSYTPGPWRPYAESSREWCIDAEDQGIACTETEANARLIAAAPDLVEALKFVCAAIHNRSSLEHLERVAGLCERTIAKAEAQIEERA